MTEEEITLSQEMMENLTQQINVLVSASDELKKIAMNYQEFILAQIKPEKNHDS